MRFIALLFFMLYTFLSFGQVCVSNPAVQQGNMTPSPLVSGGEALLSFSFILNLLDYTDEEIDPIELRVCLFEMAPKHSGNNIVTGPFSSYFTWSYDSTSNCIFGIQNQDILGGAGGIISIATIVTGPENCNPATAGFHVFLTPATCMNGINETIDDNVNFHGCVVENCVANLCTVLHLGGGVYDDQNPLAQRDCDGGGIDNITECEEGTDPDDPADDCTAAISGGIDICAIINADPNSSLATKDCDGGGIDNSTECASGPDPTDPDDDCEAAIQSAIDICAIINANPNSPLATQDCDEGGIDNASECDEGSDPADPEDDCDAAIALSADICAIITANPNIPMATQDCDEGGIDNTTECANGTHPGCDDDDCEAAILGGIDICAILALNPNSPLAIQDCDEGGALNISECNLGTNPNLATDDCTTGPIAGCNLVCVGAASNQTKQYVSTFINGTTWSISPGYLVPFGQITILSGQGTSNLLLDFSNFIANESTITLLAEGTSICGFETHALTIYMDRQCVWPGDVNNDNQQASRFENWVNDVLIYGIALDQLNQLPVTDTLIAASRPLSCLDGALTDWEAQACPDWLIQTVPSTFVPCHVFFHDSVGNPDSLNAKYADCNGDGVLDFSKNWNNFQDSFSTVSNPSDHDVMFYHTLKNSHHNGNSFKSNNNNLLFEVLTLDTVYANGSAINFNILMGDLMHQIPNVNQVAFVAEATLGLDPLPFTLLNNSHLTTDSDHLITYVDFPNGYTGNIGDSLHYYVVINNPQQAVTFKGEQVCNLVCVATVAGLLDHGGTQGGNKNLVDSIPFTFKISTAGIGTTDQAPIYSSSAELTVHVLLDPLLDAKILLEGCTDPTTGLMDDNLRKELLIPYTEPYAADSNYVYAMQELKGIQLDSLSQLFGVTGPKAIVDWVFVEVRDQADSSLLIWSRAALVNREGSIVDLDGVSPVQLSRIPRGRYHVLIRHRTHLPVMTSTPVYLDRNASLVDFTTGQNSTNQVALTQGQYGMIMGDCNGDQVVNSVDRSAGWNMRNSSGYFTSDINMDGTVNASDRVIFWNNRNQSTNLP